MTFDWDVNQRTRVHEGDEIEPILGLAFGWNMNDWFAPELSFRYTTSSNGGRREHVIGSNIGFLFTPNFKPLLDFVSLRILPFVRPGLTAQVAVLPGDVNAADRRASSKGIGPSIGGGVRFLFNEYLYFGIEVAGDFIYHEGQSQNLTPGGITTIYLGGWKKQLESLATVGVHF